MMQRLAIHRAFSPNIPLRAIGAGVGFDVLPRVAPAVTAAASLAPSSLSLVAAT